MREFKVIQVENWGKRSGGGSWESKVKRQTRRRFRRYGKRLLDEAPTKYAYCGWTM